MSMFAEITVGAFLAIAIPSFAAGVTFLAFFGYPWLHRRAMKKQFPIVVPGTPGMRMDQPPVSTITVDDVARAWTIFRARCVQKGYSGRKIDREFKKEYIDFVRASNDEGERYIVDRWGRKIAGDRSKDICRVVVIDGDHWDDTAGFHEWGHGVHVTKGKKDYEHRDDIMWHEIVGWCKKQFRATA